MKKLLLITIMLSGFNWSFAQTNKPADTKPKENIKPKEKQEVKQKPKAKDKPKVKPKESVKLFDYNKQFLVYGGGAVPLGTYGKFPGNAKTGLLAGLVFDNYFKFRHWGIGADLRYFNNPLKKEEIDQTQKLNFATIITHFNNKPAFQNIALTLGPTFRTAKGKFQFETYAKFGVLFEQFPNYITDGVNYEGRKFIISYTNNAKDKTTAGVAIIGARFFYKINRSAYLFFQTDYLSSLGNNNSKFNFYENLKTPDPLIDDQYLLSSFKSLKKNSVTPIKTFNAAIGIKFVISTAPKPVIVEKPKFNLIGKTITKGTQTPAANVKTMLTNVSDDKKKTGTSDKNGDFSYTLEPNKEYTIVGMKDGFPSNIEKISTKGLSKSQTFYVNLELSIKSLEVGSVMELKNIYYDLNKADIRSDAAAVLDNLVRVLKENPTIKIELSSHTDSRSSDEYNMELSQRRADTAVQYLISQGIDEKRLIAKGYGESKLINKCADGIDCTEEEHQQNRRTEIKILSK